MATLSDENTTTIGRNVGRLISALMKLLYRNLLNWLEQRAEKNLRQLEKKNPQRIQTADIDRDNLDKFKILAQQNGIKKYKIEKDKHDTPTLKYDIKDQYKITEIYKQMENGYRIPENDLMAIMERFTDTNVLTNRIHNILHYSHEDIQQELQNPKHYREEELLNQENKNVVQEIYDKSVKEVTGKENNVKLDMDEIENQRSEERRVGKECRKKRRTENNEKKKT